MLKAFIFDMDGTLIDNMGIHAQVWTQLLSEYSVIIEPAEFFRQTAGNTNVEILRRFIDPLMPEEEVRRLADHKEALYRRRFAGMLQPIPGLPAFLQAAQAAGLKLAVASSAGHANISFHLQGLEMEQWFGAIIGAEDVTRGKPHPDLFLAAAAGLGVAPEDCLVFEDAPAGLEAARRAGMHAVALTTSMPADILAQNPTVLRVIPDFTVIRPEDLLSNGLRENPM